MRRMSLFNAKSKKKTGQSLASFPSQKVFEAKPIEPFPRFISPGSTCGRKLFVNGRGRFPFCVRFQQLTGVKSRLVKPKKFVRLVWAPSFIENGIKSGQRTIAIGLLF